MIQKKQARSKELIRLGLLCEITDTIHIGQEILLGHLLQYKPLIEYKELGENLIKELQNNDTKKVINLDTKNKKSRNHDLITYGSLFEIAKLKDKNLAELGGYLKQIFKENEIYINQCDIVGKTYFLKLKQEKNQDKKILLFY
jgi:hypothetical protein